MIIFCFGVANRSSSQKENTAVHVCRLRISINRQMKVKNNTEDSGPPRASYVDGKAHILPTAREILDMDKNGGLRCSTELAFPRSPRSARDSSELSPLSPFRSPMSPKEKLNTNCSFWHQNKLNLRRMLKNFMKFLF